MDPIICSICDKTNHIPNGQHTVVALFSQRIFAQNVLQDIEKAHIIPAWSKIVAENNSRMLVVQLHGMKDVVQLQSLYIESMCQENNALTVEIVTTKSLQDKLLQQLP